MLTKVKENLWSVVALAVLGIALLTSSGGLAAVRPLLKFLVPIIFLVVIFKWAKKTIIGRVQDAISQQMGGQTGAFDPQKLADLISRKKADQSPVIDLCPKCGSYLSPGHRCKT